MSIADFEYFLTLVPIARQRRSVLREGYATLLELGWPTVHIDWKMCERAFAGLVSRYKGGESWAQYKERWAGEDIKRGQLPMRPLRKQDSRKPLTLPQMNLPGAPYLTLEMWVLQPSQPEASVALPRLEIPHPSPSFAERAGAQVWVHEPMRVPTTCPELVEGSCF